MKFFLQIVFFFIYAGSWAQSSVLSSGDWYKIAVTESGIYKIDRNTLDALGVPATVNPEEIRLFGNGVRGILPQENSMPRPSDLQENPILVSGDSDGSFDSDDYILFYAFGPHREVWDADGFDYGLNIYSDTAYYFLSVSGPPGKRIVAQESLTDDSAITIATFDDHIGFESDEVNIISSGRRWLGEILSGGERLSFDYFLEGLVGQVSCNMTVVNQSPQLATFEITNDRSAINSITVSSIPSGPGTTYSLKGEEETVSFTFSSSEDLALEILYEANTSDSRGYLDLFTLTFQRDLRLYGVETDFRTTSGVNEVIEYQIDNVSGATIWNVSNAENIYQQNYEIIDDKISFKSQSDEVEEFVIFSGSDFPSPFVMGTVKNQDIKDKINFDGLIVAAPAFLAEAERLAQFHLTHDGLLVQVVTPRQIYNEFSSGRQDITAIRDYARYMYENGGRLKYLLLFGDCSYDYKDRISFNTNLVPTYESRESFDPIFSYSSDDYFAFLDEDEGAWIESRSGDHTMEIGVGRLPARSVGEAEVMVDKIIYYATSPNTLGKWRNEITYVADDGDGNRHVDDAESLSILVDSSYAQYNINKLFLDAFEQESGASKDLSPQATAALKTRIKEGTFLINFLGHGNENLWTEEEIITKDEIAELTNRNKLPIFVTATCEFGRFDDPTQVSGAEELMLLETGGGIALLTTSRPVFASTNFTLNQAFHTGMYQGKKRLGDIIKETKNNGLEGAVNRNFTLLGDPMMRPAFPELQIVLEDSNNELDTLSALETISISGEVRENDVTRTDFNGRLVARVYDEAQEFETRGQEDTPYTYELRSNVIFSGEATVQNGVFDFSFIVPKNISYQFERGKISVYAWDYDSNLDADGSSRDIVVGGTAVNVEADTEPPLIEMYLNDETFQNGGVVGNSPLLIARLSDQSGITTSSIGVVEGIVLEIGDQTINLNEFYTASPDSFQEGYVVYPLVDLETGKYDVSLKVWDTHNNSTTSSISFEVTDAPRIFIFNEVAYPNPAVDYMKFYFEHDREDEDLNVDFRVFNSKGEMLHLAEYLIRNANREVEIEWDLSTSSGQRLNQGVYYYQLLIKSNFDGAAKEIAKKLVLSK